MKLIKNIFYISLLTLILSCGKVQKESATSLNHDGDTAALFGNTQSDYCESYCDNKMNQSTTPKRLITEAAISSLNSWKPEVRYKVESLLKIANSLYEDLLIKVLFNETDESKLKYINNIKREISDALFAEMFLAQKGFSSASEDATNLAFMTKGRIQDALTMSMAGIHNKLSLENQKILDELKNKRTEYSNKLIKGISSNDPEMKILDTRINRLQHELAVKSKEFAIETESISIEDIMRHLKENEILIDIEVVTMGNSDITGMEFTLENGKKIEGKQIYFAIIITSSQKPIIKWLGFVDEIDDKIMKLRQSIAERNSYNTKILSQGLGGYFKNILDNNKEKILFSSDGMFNVIPFEILIDDETGKYFIEKYDITYITSPHDLFRFDINQPSRTGAFVIGNPDYNLASINSTANSSNHLLGLRSGDFTSFEVPPLPGTKLEAASIAKTLNGQLITDSQATESVVKHVKGPKILHIATHGFFLPDTSMDTFNNGLSNNNSNQQVENKTDGANKIIENSLLRSGLLFSGVNHLKSDEDDGVLTALEASDLDLWGTKLVVLSACETGLGDVKNGEGVFGLRRAFWLAGAESIVMSLWSVSDEATRALMIDFYENLNRGESKSEALRSAQLKMLHSKQWSHPFYWASFVLIGNGGPLH